MTRTPLDEKLECPKCRMIRLSIPDDVSPTTPIHCSNCGCYLGTWSELEESFLRQAKGSDLFELKDGTIVKR